MTAAQIAAATRVVGHLLARDLPALQWLEPTSVPISTELEWDGLYVTGHYVKSPGSEDVEVRARILPDGSIRWDRREWPEMVWRLSTPLLSQVPA